LRDEFPHTAKPDDQEPDAVEVYRQALASAPEASVKIVSVGYLCNLRDLLKSGPDKFSSLAGVDLIRKKVSELVIMGGQFPASSPTAGEYNLASRGAGPVSREVIENWPTPILFSGFEIGRSIFTNRWLAAVKGHNPVRRAFELFDGFHGHPSFDETAVLAAVRPPGHYWNIVANGWCQVASNGTDRWTTTPRGHSYLVSKISDAEMAAVLNDLMTLPPKARQPPAAGPNP
jgi:hypothetical protein